MYNKKLTQPRLLKRVEVDELYKKINEHNNSNDVNLDHLIYTRADLIKGLKLLRLRLQLNEQSAAPVLATIESFVEQIQILLEKHGEL